MMIAHSMVLQEYRIKNQKSDDRRQRSEEQNTDPVLFSRIPYTLNLGPCSYRYRLEETGMAGSQAIPHQREDDIFLVVRVKHND
jgi:hypothetical protein